MAVETPAGVDAASAPRGSGLWSVVWRGLVAAFRHPWVVTAGLCAVLLALPVTGGDLAAQEFHTWVFRAQGAVLWNDWWYSGHLLGGYSLLTPPLAAVVGTRFLGALACVGAAAAASDLFGGTRAGLGARIGALWFALGCVGSLIVGQVPFGLGVAFGLAAMVAVKRGHPWLAAVAAVAGSLASPLAGAFLLMAGLAWCSDIGLRRVAPLGAAVVGLVMASVIGGGGFFPFPRRALLIILLLTIGGLILVRDLSRTLRWALVLYGVSAVALWAVQNPVGGNLGRIGALVAGPIAAAVLGARRRWWTLVIVAIPLLWWQVWPTVSAVNRSVNDPSSRADYYTGLTTFLATQDVAQGRLEVPNLRQHWESYFVAKKFPLARGWERQIDLRDNEILYHPDLTADQLHAWLVRSGVRLVAVPDAPIDYWSSAEARIVSAGQPWLQPVWSDAHWRVWRLTDSLTLTTGAGRLTHLGVDSFDLAVDRTGPTVVRLHWSPYWQVTSGSACLQPSSDGWVTVVAQGTGTVSVATRWSVTAAVRPAHAADRCG